MGPSRLAIIGASALMAMGAALFYLVVVGVPGKPGFYIWRVFSGKAHGGRSADVNNVRIYFETYGSGSPVLVLHGGLGRSEDMRHQIRALASTRFVIAPDSRGHGRSTDADVPLTYSLMAEDMVKLLDQLGIAQVDVVGWSDGGIIGLDLALHHPERVRRLVSIGSNYDVDGLINRPEFGVGLPRACGRILPCSPDQAFARKVITMWQTLPQYTLNDLGKINARTLIIAGEFDVIKRTHSDQLAKAISGSREEIIKGTTHFLITEKPDIVNSEILEFLDER
jgi:pimeloyl-ACP methyl ester carboxylesterase